MTLSGIESRRRPDLALARPPPAGALSEISGPSSSGRTTLLLRLLARATAAGSCAAVIDPSDGFDPPSAEAQGVVLDRVLWVRAPQDRPVGFVNQGARIFNLLRDDLGAEGDATDLNYEVSYSRGIPAG